jgi:hypothetical protein
MRSPGDDLTTTTLVNASNKHTENFTGVAVAMTGLDSRIAALENIAPSGTRITQLDATLGAISSSLQVLMGRMSTYEGSAPILAVAPNVAATPAPAVAVHGTEALFTQFQEFLNASGKRPREDDDVDNTTRNVRTHLDVAPVASLPPAFHFVPSGAGPALATAPVLPRAPATGPPRTKNDPKREVVLGPMKYGNMAQDSRAVISTVIPAAARTSFRGYHARRGADENHAICVFESEAIADWIIEQWNTATVTRVGYEIVTVRKSPNV